MYEIEIFTCTYLVLPQGCVKSALLCEIVLGTASQILMNIYITWKSY